MNALFDISAADVADTNDDWYTPPWLFKAAALVFDVDVAAPVDPARRTCPALTYLTVVDDGLAAPWDGLVWCNPPYSRPGPWVERFARHDGGGLLLVPAVSSRWMRFALRSDALTLIRCDFLRPDGKMHGSGRAALVLAAKGLASIDALARVARADPYADGAYHVRPAGRDWT